MNKNPWREIRSGLSDNILVVVMVALVLFGMVGYRTYPRGDRVLTWDLFRSIQTRGTFDAELARLRGTATQMSMLLARESADPLETAQMADRIRSLTGLEPLAPQRQALTAAAAAIHSWASGALPREEAIAVLDEAVASLEAAYP